MVAPYAEATGELDIPRIDELRIRFVISGPCDKKLKLGRVPMNLQDPEIRFNLVMTNVVTGEDITLDIRAIYEAAGLYTPARAQFSHNNPPETIIAIVSGLLPTHQWDEYVGMDIELEKLSNLVYWYIYYSLPIAFFSAAEEYGVSVRSFLDKIFGNMDFVSVQMIGDKNGANEWFNDGTSQIQYMAFRLPVPARFATMEEFQNLGDADGISPPAFRK